MKLRTLACTIHSLFFVVFCLIGACGVAPAPSEKPTAEIPSAPALPSVAPASNATGSDSIFMGNEYSQNNMDGSPTGGERFMFADWSNGNPFDARWQTDNTEFSSNGILSLILDTNGCPTACDGHPYASAEMRTQNETFEFGMYEVRMKAAKGSGLVTSFFTYRGTHGKADHDEIDFEVLGKDTSKVQINYYVEGQGGHEYMVDLGFDASTDFHNYGLSLTPEKLTWYVDGKEVNSVSENPSTPKHELPYRPAKIMINLWPGISVDGWLGPFTYHGQPVTAEYDWIRWSQNNEKTASPVAEAPR